MAPSLKYVQSFIGDSQEKIKEFERRTNSKVTQINDSGKINQLCQNVDDDDIDPSIDDTFVNSRDDVDQRVNQDQISRRDPIRIVKEL